jgi:alpha-amylase
MRKPLLACLLLASIAGTGAAAAAPDGGGFASYYPSMFLRGSMNNWGAREMQLVADHTWQVTARLDAHTAYQYKFEVSGGEGWSTNFGDQNADGVADQGAGNIEFTTRDGGKYLFQLNDDTFEYTVTAPAPGSQAGLKMEPVVHTSGPPKPNRPWTDDVLYFVITDRFADGDPANDADVDPKQPGTFHGGDLKGLTAHLDEIASLGVTALWITPIVKQVEFPVVSAAGFKDWPYHGYWADDYGKVDPHLGTEADLAKLIDACHRRGIKLLLDVVYNHAGYDSRYAREPETRSWLRSSHNGGCSDENVLTMCVGGLPDWKTEDIEVRDWLLEQQLRWPMRFPIDGFRLDTVKHVDHPFWRKHRKVTQQLFGKGFFLLGEVYGATPEWLNREWFPPDELDAALDFTFQGSALGFVMGKGRPVAFDQYLASRQEIRPGHLLAPYLSSHDVVGALKQLQGDRDLFRLAAVLEMTVSGVPVIYYGEEVARPGGDWPENRGDMPWGNRKIKPGAGLPRDEKMRAFYQRIIGIRRSHPALMRGGHRGLVTDDDSVYVFQRSAEGDAVVVALNRSRAPAVVSFAAPPEWKGARIQELLEGGELPIVDGAAKISIPPQRARIFGVAAKAKPRP